MTDSASAVLLDRPTATPGGVHPTGPLEGEVPQPPDPVVPAPPVEPGLPEPPAPEQPVPPADPPGPAVDDEPLPLRDPTPDQELPQPAIRAREALKAGGASVIAGARPVHRGAR